jgi:hypothetical protein
MFLLGAGASIPAGIPGAFDMLDAIRKQLDSGAHTRQLLPVLHFVEGGIAFSRGIAGEDPTRNINVEEVFSAVLLLADREQLEVAPFVSAWHPRIASLESPVKPPFAYKGVVSAIRGMFADSRGNSRSDFFVAGDLERALEPLFQRNTDSRIFRSLAEEMTRSLIDICAVGADEPDRFDHLRPLLDFAASERRLAVATLNYDTLVESLAEASDVAISRGLRELSSGVRWDRSADMLYLLKLHGSADWRLKTVRGEGMIEHVAIEEASQDENDRRYGDSPGLVFGQRDKLTTDGPFVALLEAFGAELEDAEHLVVIGYSFRDKHVNDYLARWFNRQRGRLTILDPGFPMNESPFAIQLRRCDSSRLHVIAEGVEDALGLLVERAGA